MSRWEPNARERLAEAALSLSIEQGYATTTVQQIAARAGLTERTFFRHFADKREALFGGSARLLEILVGSVAAAPATAGAFAVVEAAIDDVCATLQQRRSRESARQRRALLVQNAELLERELMKMAAMSTALANALRDRGVADDSAALAAEAGVAVFRVAFDRWLDDTAEQRTLAAHARAAFAALRAL